MIRRILAIAGVDLRMTHTGSTIILFRVLVPIALILVIGYANGAFLTGDIAAPLPRLVLVDDDNTLLSRYLAETLGRADVIRTCTDASQGGELGDWTCPNLADPNALVREGRADAALIIPEGFGNRLIEAAGATEVTGITEQSAGNGPSVELIAAVNQDDRSLESAVQGALGRVAGLALARSWGSDIRQSIDFLGDEYVDAVVDRARDLWAQDPVAIASRSVELRDAEDGRAEIGGGFRQSVPGMGSMYVMFAMLAGVSLLVWERKNWTLQRLATMPVTKGEFIAGKLVSRLVVGLGQFAVAFAAGAIIGKIAGVDFGRSPVALVLVMLAFSSFVGSLTLLLATIVTSPAQASAVSTFLALTLAPIGGAWWSLDLEFIPDLMREIAIVSPFYWAMDGFSAVIEYGGGVPATLPSLAILFGTSLVLFALAVARFRFDRHQT